MEQLIALVYTSKASSTIDLQILKDILKISQIRNEQNEITGFLTIRDGVFLQMIEGPQTLVMACYEKIQTDPRHSQITLQGLGQITQRALSKWSMGIIDPEKTVRSPEILSLFEAGRAGAIYTDPETLLALLKIFTRNAVYKQEPDFDINFTLKK